MESRTTDFMKPSGALLNLLIAKTCIDAVGSHKKNKLLYSTFTMIIVSNNMILG